MKHKIHEKHGETSKKYANGNGRSKYQASRLYRAWHHLFDNKEINVCDDWHSFVEFRKWAVANGFDELTGRIHFRRIFKEGTFEPGNVYIDTIVDPAHVFLTKDGMTMCLTEWAKYLGISKQCLWARVNVLKWSIEKALTKGLSPKEEITFE